MKTQALMFLASPWLQQRRRLIGLRNAPLMPQYYEVIFSFGVDVKENILLSGRSWPSSTFLFLLFFLPLTQRHDFVGPFQYLEMGWEGRVGPQHVADRERMSGYVGLLHSQDPFLEELRMQRHEELRVGEQPYPPAAVAWKGNKEILLIIGLSHTGTAYTADIIVDHLFWFSGTPHLPIEHLVTHPGDDRK